MNHTNTHKTIQLIGVPTDIGAGARGASMGPEALRVAGIVEMLRAQQLSPLVQKIISQANDECNEYHEQYALLDDDQTDPVRSWHVLMQLRMDLLRVIQTEPEELFKGLVSIAPLRKWWRVVRT